MMHVADFGMLTRAETEEYAWGFKSYEGADGLTYYVFEVHFPAGPSGKPYYFRELSTNPERIVGLLVSLLTNEEFREEMKAAWDSMHGEER